MIFEIQTRYDRGTHTFTLRAASCNAATYKKHNVFDTSLLMQDSILALLVFKPNRICVIQVNDG